MTARLRILDRIQTARNRRPGSRLLRSPRRGVCSDYGSEVVVMSNLPWIERLDINIRSARSADAIISLR